MFCHRRECHLQQVPNWTKLNKPITVDLLKKHINGEVTIGSYQISLEKDTVIWACFDIDTHNGEQDTDAKLGRLIAVLRKYDIPFLLEASGSLKSYHIWVFLQETRTYNAYRFCQQVKAEADIKDSESFPKQKGLNKNSKYGNQVKVPVCLNRKSKGRSAFLDPDTMEPILGLIVHPGLVKLLDVPELTESRQSGIPRLKALPHKIYEGSDYQVDLAEKYATDLGYIDKKSGPLYRLKKCPFCGSIDKGAVVGRVGEDGGYYFTCHHDRCATKHWPDLRAYMTA